MKEKIFISLLSTAMLALMFGNFVSAFAKNENPPTPNVIALNMNVTPRGQTVTSSAAHPYRASWRITFQGQSGQSSCFHVDYGDGFLPWYNCGYMSGQQATVVHDFNHPGDPAGRYNQTWWAEGVGGPSTPRTTYVIKK